MSESLFSYGSYPCASVVEESRQAKERRGARHQEAARIGSVQIALSRAWHSLSERPDLWEAHPALKQAALAALAGLGPLSSATLGDTFDSLLGARSPDLPQERVPEAVEQLASLDQFPSSPARAVLAKGMPQTIQEAAAKPKMFGRGLGLAWCSWSGVAARAAIWQGVGLEGLWGLELAGVGAKDREVFNELAALPGVDLAPMFEACHPWVAACLAGPKAPWATELRSLWRPEPGKALDAAAAALASAGFELGDGGAFAILAQEELVGDEGCRQSAAKHFVEALINRGAAKTFNSSDLGKALSVWFDKAPGACSGEDLGEAFVAKMTSMLDAPKRWRAGDAAKLLHGAKGLHAWSLKRKSMRVPCEAWARAGRVLTVALASSQATHPWMESDSRSKLSEALTFFSSLAGAQATPSHKSPRL
jgi:hypothetical protein